MRIKKIMMNLNDHNYNQNIFQEKNSVTIHVVVSPLILMSYNIRSIYFLYHPLFFDNTNKILFPLIPRVFFIKQGFLEILKIY
jgi:hypothetical protein